MTGDKFAEDCVHHHSACSHRAVEAYCRTQIAGYKQPRYVVFTDELPWSRSGKISKVGVRRHCAKPEGLREIKG